jgi:tol-pal system protein YbgF
MRIGAHAGVRGDGLLRRVAAAGLLRCVAVAALAASAGCASSYDLRQVRSDQKEVRGMLADLRVAVDKMQRQVATLEAEADQIQGRGRAGGRGTLTLADLEKRVAVVENRLKLIEQAQPAGAMGALPPGMAGEERPPGEIHGGTGEVASTPTATPARTGIDAAREDDALAAARADETFGRAFDSMRSGRYSEAIPQFREYLRKNPRSDYADDAQYYIGESYYSTRDYNRAILEFNEVLLKYPRGKRVPAALLRQATAFAELGDKVDARLILQKLVGEYPNTAEAARARELLQQMGE